MQLREFHKYIIHDDKQVKGFFQKYRFLSNFECSPIYFCGLVFPSVENAYQAAKVRGTEAEHLLEEFSLMTPRRSKSVGNKIKLRSDWGSAKYDIMRQLNYAKYETHPDLLEMLLATKDRYLEETNSWGDVIWGVDYKTGEGSNWLGKILMDVRSEFQGYQKQQLDLFDND